MFVTAVQTVMDIFEDQIRSLSRDIRLKAYKILMQSYKVALTAIWDSAQNADITPLYHSQHSIIFYINSTVLSRLTTSRFILLYYPIFVLFQLAYIISIVQIIIMYLPFFFTPVNKFQKIITRGKHGLKYQKLCHYPNPLPRGREGSLTANNPSLSATNVIRLNRTHSFLNLQQNFSFPLLELWLIASKLNKIHSNLPT